MMNTDVLKRDYLFAERCIAQHQINRFEIERVKDRIEIYVNTIYQNCPERIKEIFGVENTDYPEDIIKAVIDKNEEIKRLSVIMGAINAFMETLTEEEYKFIFMRYVQHQSWHNIANEMFISVNSARGHWRNKLLKRALKILTEHRRAA